jgi:hypothetical protein
LTWRCCVFFCLVIGCHEHIFRQNISRCGEMKFQTFGVEISKDVEVLMEPILVAAWELLNSVGSWSSGHARD